MLVTGAGRGIGRAVAELAAGRGYRVAVHGHRSAAAVASVAASIGGHAVIADLADPAAIESMFAALDADGFDHIDVLVNNAGTAAGYGPIGTYHAAPIAEMLAVNVTAVLLCTQHAVQRMSAGASIVNISSKAAVLGGAGEWVPYAASKGAVDTMTIGLARELAGRQIRVNGVRPGLIDTDFHDHAPPGRMTRMAPTIPLGRSGSAAEVAEAALWLASDAASYVTGAILDVSGGR